MINKINKKLEEELYKKQDGACKICGKKNVELRNRPKTKKVRGLICGRCNMGLDGFEDNINNLESAIKYLK